MAPPGRPSRKCRLCGARAGSREHVFPAWLGKVLPGEGEFMFVHARDGQPPRSWRSGALSLTYRGICDSCNHWLGSNVEETARPVLTRLIEGAPTTLPVAAPTRRCSLRGNCSPMPARARSDDPAGPATVSSEETEHGRRRCDQGRSRVDSTLLTAKKRDGIPEADGVVGAHLERRMRLVVVGFLRFRVSSAVWWCGLNTRVGGNYRRDGRCRRLPAGWWRA
jgi:hypothetical protein